MASTISLEFRDRLLRCYFRQEQMNDDTLYAALTRQVAFANQSGATLDEPEAAAYQRVAIPLDPDNWVLTGFGEVYNTLAIDFPDPEPDVDWGYLGGWALLDGPDDGMTLAVGSLVLPTYYTADMPPLSLEPGAIMLALDD